MIWSPDNPLFSQIARDNMAFIYDSFSFFLIFQSCFVDADANDQEHQENYSQDGNKVTYSLSIIEGTFLCVLPNWDNELWVKEFHKIHCINVFYVGWRHSNDEHTCTLTTHTNQFQRFIVTKHKKHLQRFRENHSHSQFSEPIINICFFFFWIIKCKFHSDTFFFLRRIHENYAEH